VKLAVVVQRYGADINGGAELHARYVAEHCPGTPAVDVLTTCARDYVTWRDDFRRDGNRERRSRPQVPRRSAARIRASSASGPSACSTIRIRISTS
jgi:hypothetical protein